MKNISKGLIALILTLFLAGSGLGAGEVLAEAPYKTYTIDGYGYVTETQTAYVPYGSITKIGDKYLNAPRDMKITKDGEIYIADTGNRRIIVSDLAGNYIKEFGADVLINPCGLFVTEEKYVYVADRDAAKIFVFSRDGTVIAEYGRPNHPLYGETMDFKPIKIAVNEAGIMYVVSEANTNGIVQISPKENGTFLGYFGTNYANTSLGEIILRLLLTDAQLAKMVSNLPPSPDNLAIDEQGLIYTITRGDGLDSLKRLNIAGKNLIDPDAYDDYPVAVVPGNYDNVFMASNYGYIYEFNNEGELLFVFGGRDDGRQRIGLCKKVEAIAVDQSDLLYVLDSDMNQIHIFAPTEFTNLLHEALYLYFNGRYTQSKEPLKQVIQMNSMFDYANEAMGKAYLQEENYEMALHYAKLAKDHTTYSDAFWEVRNLWLRKNLISLIGVLLALYMIVRLLKFLQKKHGIFGIAIRIINKIKSKPLITRLTYSLYFIKHPIDGCYGVRWEQKASYLSANILIGLYLVFSVIYRYFCGFLVKTVREGRYDLLSDIGMVLAAFFLLTVCNYLICTINDGEGSFKQLYSGFAYCLTPYLVMQPFIFLLSHLITYNEVFLIRFAETFRTVWIVVLIVITIKEINNYTLKETFKIIGLTFFAALIAMLIIFILYVLWSQVFDFVQAIGGEVVYRLGL